MAFLDLSLMLINSTTCHGQLQYKYVINNMGFDKYEFPFMDEDATQ
jgi:hypothetical protein